MQTPQAKSEKGIGSPGEALLDVVYLICSEMSLKWNAAFFRRTTKSARSRRAMLYILFWNILEMRHNVLTFSAEPGTSKELVRDALKHFNLCRFWLSSESPSLILSFMFIVVTGLTCLTPPFSSIGGNRTRMINCTAAASRWHTLARLNFKIASR